MTASKPNAETHRIRALAYLASGDLSEARLEIGKALEMEPRWEAIRMAFAVINYFSALSTTMPLRALPGWPEPVDWIAVKRDEGSVQRLREAAEVFRHLAEDSIRGEEERRTLESWHLACLANDPDRQGEAAQYCRRLLSLDPIHFRAIAWATARKLDIDLSESEAALTSLVTEGRAEVPHILALLSINLERGKPTQALTLLMNTKSLFQSKGAQDLWSFSYAQSLVLVGDPQGAISATDSLVSDPKAQHIRTMALRSIAETTGNWDAVFRHLEASYAATRDPLLLLDLCQLKARREEWDYVADRAEELLQGFRTAESLRLAAIASFNVGRHNFCLSLLDSNRDLFRGQTLSSELRRMRVLCQRAIGALPSALVDAESMAREEPSTANLLDWIQLQFEVGDLKGLAIVARQLFGRPDLSVEQLLHLAGLVQWEDPELSRSLWRRAVREGLPDDAVGSALRLGYQLGLDSELRPILARMAELSKEGRGGVHRWTLDDLLSMTKQHWENSAKLEEFYKKGIAPIHVIAERANRPLADLYHHVLKSNEASPNPRSQPSLLIRHGGRALAPISANGTPGWRLNLDLSAVLLSAHLDILDKVESAFSPLRIPKSLVPALILMRDRITPHQPSRVLLYQQIVDLVENGTLYVVDSPESPQLDSKQRLEKLATERTALFEHALSTGGYVVDFATSSSSDTNDSSLAVPSDANRQLINCRSIADSLRQNGPLSEHEYAIALNELGSEGLQSPSQVIPQEGSTLFCRANIPEVLAQAGLLRMACQRFRVYIERNELSAARASLSAYHDQREMADWLGSLIDRLRQGLGKNIYEIITSPAARKTPPEKGDGGGLDVQCLLTLFKFEPQQNDVLWVDDRFTNSYLHRDGVPIIGINEVLRALVSSNAMDAAEHFRVLGRLRASNVRFIPVQKDEVLHCLHQARIEDGALIETRDLSVLRQYIASCLLSTDTLQRPPMPKDTANEHGELAFIISLGRAVMDSIVDLWAGAEDVLTCQARAEWLICNVYLDHLALAKAASVERSEQKDQYLTALTLAGLISQAITLDSRQRPDGRSVRHDYFEWLQSRLLRQRFDVDPPLLAAVADILKKVFLDVRERGMHTQGEKKALKAAVVIVLQRFYQDLPNPIRDELSRDADFMAGIGLKSLSAISIGDLSFEAEDFFRVAAEAINGRRAKIRPTGSIARVFFEPPEAPSPPGAFSFAHPLTGQKQNVANPELALLRESATEREDLLRRNRDWFDCLEPDFERAVAEIASEDNPRIRIEQADSWRRSSAEVHYRELHEKLRGKRSFLLADLIPPSVDGLLRHLRLPSAPSPGLEFKQLITSAAESLADTEDLPTAISRLASLPVALPSTAVSIIQRLDLKEKRVLLKRLVHMPGSPISQVHLIRLLLHELVELPPSGRLARRIVRRCVSSENTAAVEAFLAMLRWTAEECAQLPSIRSLPPAIRITIAWLHTHRLFSILSSLGAAPDWCRDFFGKEKQQAPVEIFERDLSWWFDVAHPRELNPVTVLLGGMSYALCGGPEGFVSDDLRRIFLGLAFPEVEGTPLPALPLIRDSARAPDSLGSFFGGDRGEGLSSLIGTDEARSFSSESLRALADQAIKGLAQSGKSFGYWAQLHATLGGLPPYDELIAPLKSALTGTDYSGLLREDANCAILAMHVASLQSINLADESLRQSLKGHLLKMAGFLASQDQKPRATEGRNVSGPRQEPLREPFFMLLDSALNLSIAVGSASDRSVAEFAALATKLLEAWPGMIPVCRPTFQRLCEGLPVSQSKDLWPLLVRLRAE